MIRLAISPSQNTGIEMPISASTISIGSKTVPRSTAAATPIRIDITTQITAAPSTSDSVTGVAATISGTTLWPWFVYEVRSRLMNSFFIRIRYCTGSGRSSPYWCLMALIVSGLGLRPASLRAGSTPGVWKKIRNTSTVIVNTTKTVASMRRMTKVSIRQSLTRSLARGSSASRTPSPSTFSDSTVSTIMMPGAIATHGRV